MQSLYKMLEGMGSRPSGDPRIRAKDIFTLIDVNNDGTLSEEEFVKGDLFTFFQRLKLISFGYFFFYTFCVCRKVAFKGIFLC